MAKIDVRNLYRRIGRLQTIVDAGSILIAQSSYQRPLIETVDAAGYWHVSDDAMSALRAAIDVAAGHDDGAPVGAVSMRDPRPERLEPAPDEATVIRLPFPPNRDLAANKVKSGHWTKTGELIRGEKARAIAALATWQQDEPFYTEPVAVCIRVGWGTSLHAGKSRARIEQDRDLDFDGIATCLKPIIDAFTAAKIWADDRLVKDSRLIQQVDASGDGYTELSIWPIGSPD